MGLGISTSDMMEYIVKMRGNGFHFFALSDKTVKYLTPSAFSLAPLEGVCRAINRGSIFQTQLDNRKLKNNNNNL